MAQKFRKVGDDAYIEAVKFTRNNWDEVVEFTHGTASDLRIERQIGGRATCLIWVEFERAYFTAKEGDWIIKKLGVPIKFHPCNSHFFEKTYEPI